MNYEIRKDVPITEDKRAKGKEKYPFSKMEVGDSFVVISGISEREMIRFHQSGISGRAVQFVKTKQPTWKFATRRTKTPDGLVEIAVWRIK